MRGNNLAIEDQTVSPGHGFGNAISNVGRADQARPINNLDAPALQTDDAFAVELVQGSGDACSSHSQHQR
jgi:hypothetical protein